MKKFFVLSLMLVTAGAALAQDVIYRCGNEYTNNVSQAKAKGCKPVDGSGVTVIHGTRPSTASSGGAAAPAKPRPAAPASAATASPAPVRSDNTAQKARDSDARAAAAGVPYEVIGQAGGDEVSITGAAGLLAAIQLTALRTAHESWMPAYMGG